MSIIKKEGQYHGQDYLISVKINIDSIQIELESKYDACWWNSTFTAGYLEDLTAKAGEPLKYSTFVELITNSLEKSVEGCNFAVLTFQDLEEMRSGRKNEDNGINTRSSSGSLNIPNGNQQIKKKERRYIIISKTNSKGDLVHYPLSLNAVDVDDIHKLKEQARRMKLEAEELREKSVRSSQYSRNEDIQKSTGGSFAGWIDDEQVGQLRSENELLKTKIRRVEESAWIKRGVIEMDVVVKTKMELEKALEDAKKESANELERLQRELEEKEEGLAMSRVELIKLQQQAALASLNVLSSTNQSDQSLKEKYRDEIIRETNRTQDDMLAQFRTLQMQSRELQRSSTDVDFYKSTDIKQKQRIRQLEIEVDSAVRRVSVSGRSGASSDRLFSPYNRNNSGSSRTSPSNSSVRNSKNSTLNYTNNNKTQFNASNTNNNNNNNRYNKRAVSMPSKSYSPATRNTYGTSNQNIYSRLNNNLQNNQQQQQQRSNSRNNYQVNNNRTSGSSLNNKSNSPLTVVKNSINSYANRQQQLNNKFGNSNTTTSNTRLNNTSNNRLNSNNNRSGSTNQVASRTTPPNRNTNTTNNTANRVNSNTRVSPAASRTTPANRSPLVAAGNRLGGNSNNIRTSPTLRQNRNSPAATTTTAKQQLPNKYGYQAPMRVSPAARSSNITKTTSNNMQVSPSSRYAGGNKGATNPSPGTRINNYLQSQDQRLFKKIDNAATNSSSNQNVSKEFRDMHLGNNAANPNVRELNSGLDKLSNLLKMAKN